MTITTGGGINIPVRIGMTPAQVQQAGVAAGRMFAQGMAQGAGQGGGAGGGGALGAMGRFMNTVSQSIKAAGYGNYTGPRTPTTMALTYMWRGLLGRGTVSGMVGRIGATALGFGALGTLPQEIGSHINTARTQEQSMSDLNRRAGDGFTNFTRWRDAILDTGKALGYTRDQIVALTNQYVTGVGRMDQTRMVQNLTGMQQLARAYGMDPQSITGLQTNVFRGGATATTMGPPSGTAAQVNAMMASAVEMGGMRGREQEIVNSIEGLSDMLGQRLPMVSMGMLGGAVGLMTAMNASGNQGLMGSRGMGLLQSVQGFTTGAAGGPGQNMMFQMIQAQRMATGKGPLDYASLMYQTEEGIGNAGNRAALGYGIDKFLPQGPYRNVFLAKMLGISQHQAEALGPILTGGGVGMGQLDKVIGGRDVNAMVLPFMARALAGNEDSGKVAEAFSSTLSPGARYGFMAQAGGKSGEALATLMMDYQNSTEAMLSEADKTTVAFTNFDNSLTDLAKTMMPILRESLTAWTNIFDLVNKGATPLVALADAANIASIAIYGMTGLGALSTVGNVLGGGAKAIRGTGILGKGLGGLKTAGVVGLAAGLTAEAVDQIGQTIPLITDNWDFWTKASAQGKLDDQGPVGGLIKMLVGLHGGKGQTSTSFAKGQNPFDYAVTQGFGVMNPTYGPHTGIDLGLPANTSIAALTSGIVRRTRTEGMGGNIMELGLDSGGSMLLAHLNKFLLGEGERFTAGQALALSGATGSAVEGAHLHMEVKDAQGKLIDPAQWYRDMKMSGTLNLTVAGAASGNYQVPITVGSGTMAGIVTGLYGGGAN